VLAKIKAYFTVGNFLGVTKHQQTPIFSDWKVHGDIIWLWHIPAWES